MLDIITISAFKKDYKKAKKQNKNLKLLDKVIYDLSCSQKLNQKYKNHSLKGNFINKQECHILPDWLLIYEIDNNNLVLYRTGSHAELFNK